MTPRILIVALLLLPALAISVGAGKRHLFYYKSHVIVSNGTQYPRLPGTVVVEEMAFGRVILKGSVPKSQARENYEIMFFFGGLSWDNGTYKGDGPCLMIDWNGKWMALLKGSVHYEGNFNSMSFVGYCQTDRFAPTLVSHRLPRQCQREGHGQGMR